MHCTHMFIHVQIIDQHKYAQSVALINSNSSIIADLTLFQANQTYNICDLNKKYSKLMQSLFFLHCIFILIDHI